MQPPDQPAPQDPNLNPLPGAGNNPPPMPADSPVPPSPSEGTGDDRTLALIAHLSGILTCFIGPLIIWLMKKDQPGFVEDQSKEALNFQLTALIIYIGAMVLTFIPVIGCIIAPLSILVGLGALVLSIMAGIKANEGVRYRYPVAIRLIQ